MTISEYRLPQAAFSWGELKKDANGLIPVIVQDEKTLQVRMLAYMNEEAYNTTLKTGRMTYYSRSRKEQWVKGMTSGNIQYVKSLTADCDLDTILAIVYQQGGISCHTGAESCFFHTISEIPEKEKSAEEKAKENLQ